MPFNVGPLELIIVLIIALLVVGPRRLPEMGNAVGKTIREFRRASSDIGEAATLDPGATGDNVLKPNTLQGEARPNSMSQAPSTPASKSKQDDA